MFLVSSLVYYGLIISMELLFVKFEGRHVALVINELLIFIR